MELKALKSSIVQSFQVSVTPDMAERMLAASIGNRNIRKWHVDLLAGAMKRGEWRMTHQGAAFDQTGALRDGHHRLMACVQSGVTVPIMVTVGLDPSSFDAVDQGVNRTLSDLTGWDKRVSEPLRLATIIVRSTGRPTMQQVQAVAAGGLQVALSELIDYCGSVRKFYSAAPMRLAAGVMIMTGRDVGFVLSQYRAMCNLDYNAMTPCSKALARQVNSLKTRAGHSRDALARGLRVFDVDRAALSRIQVSEADAVAAVEMVRRVLKESIGEDDRHRPSGRIRTQKRGTFGGFDGMEAE